MGSQSLALYQAHIETSIKTKFKSNKQTTKKTNNAGTYGYTTPEFLDGIDREKKKKRLDWLMKTDPNEFMRLSEAAAQEAPGKIENTIGKGQEKLLDDVGGIATLTGTSASVIGEKSSDAQLEADRFPKNQVIAKYQTMPPKEPNYEQDADYEGEEGEGETDCVAPEMRPPSGATKKLLYEGFSKEGLGRKKYLETRK